MRAAQHGGAGGSPVRSGLMPPPTDRGAKLTDVQIEVGIHSATFVFDCPTEYALGAVLYLLHGDSDDKPNSHYWQQHFHGARGYKQLWFGPLGIKVYGDPFTFTKNGSTHSCIEFPGSAMEQVPMARLREWLLLYGEVINLDASRLDFYADHCPFTPYQLSEAADLGDVRTRVRKVNSDGTPREWHKLIQSPLGTTFNLGSRSSERYLRCYDKRGFTRLEVEYSGERASLLLAELLRAEVCEWPDVYIAWLRDFVDFVDSASDENINRAELLDWWQSFVGLIPRAGVTLSKVVDTLQKSREWVEKQVVTTLAMLRDAAGDANDFWQWLYGSVEGGKNRFRAKHRYLLASASLRL